MMKDHEQMISQTALLFRWQRSAEQLKTMKLRLYCCHQTLNRTNLVTRWQIDDDHDASNHNFSNEVIKYLSS